MRRACLREFVSEVEVRGEVTRRITERGGLTIDGEQSAERFIASRWSYHRSPCRRVGATRRISGSAKSVTPRAHDAVLVRSECNLQRRKHLVGERSHGRRRLDR
jgi:hypothetical protein